MKKEGGGEEGRELIRFQCPVNCVGYLNVTTKTDRSPVRLFTTWAKLHHLSC